MQPIDAGLVVLLALTGAAPAGAQTAGPEITASMQQFRADINAGIRNGSISSGEGMALRDELNMLTWMAALYSRDGWESWERSAFDARMGSLRRGIRSPRSAGRSLK